MSVMYFSFHHGHTDDVCVTVMFVMGIHCCCFVFIRSTSMCMFAVCQSGLVLGMRMWFVCQLYLFIMDIVESLSSLYHEHGVCVAGMSLCHTISMLFVWHLCRFIMSTLKMGASSHSISGIILFSEHILSNYFERSK